MDKKDGSPRSGLAGGTGLGVCIGESARTVGGFWLIALKCFEEGAPSSRFTKGFLGASGGTVARVPDPT